MTERIPDRVSADLARHESDLRDAANDAFDEYQEDHIKAVVPSELVKPVMDLLLARREMIMAERIGGLDKARAADQIGEDLDRLRSACVSRWRDL